jgi:hypothetical protein
MNPVLPPPSEEMKKDDAFKKQEETFLTEMFDNNALSRNKPKPQETNPMDGLPPEPDPEKKEEPPKEPEAKEPEKKEPEPPADKKPETDGLLGDQPAGDKKDPAPPADKDEPEPQPVIDAEDIANRVADKLKVKPQPEPPKADPMAGFNDEDKEELKVLQELGNSPKYKGRDLVKETTEFWRREEEYTLNWKKNNPGKKFNSEDDEHAEFYDANQPDIADKDITDAHITVRAREIAAKEIDARVKKEVDPIRQELSAAARDTLEIKIKPIIATGVAAAVAAMAVEAVPEFKEILKDGKLTPEAVDAMQEQDPAAMQAINREGRALRARVAEVKRMAHLGEHFEFDAGKRVELKDGEVIRPHQEIMDAAIALENKIIRGPKEGKIRDGRHFISTSMFHAKMDEAEKNGDRKAQEFLMERFWIIGPDDIEQALVQQSAQKVKGYLEIANARGSKQEKKTPPKDGNQPPKQDEKKPAGKLPPVSPSTPSSSGNQDTKIPAPPAQDNHAKVVDRAFFS